MCKVDSEQTTRLYFGQNKLQMFGNNALQHLRQKPNTAHQHKQLTPTVKHGGGGLMI